jgi:hypothetical protein
MFLDLNCDPAILVALKMFAELSVCQRLAGIHHSLPCRRPRLRWRMSNPTCTFGEFV